MTKNQQNESKHKSDIRNICLWSLLVVISIIGLNLVVALLLNIFAMGFWISTIISGVVVFGGIIATIGGYIILENYLFPPETKKVKQKNPLVKKTEEIKPKRRKQKEIIRSYQSKEALDQQFLKLKIGRVLLFSGIILLIIGVMLDTILRWLILIGWI